jgi:hypothetical protein
MSARSPPSRLVRRRSRLATPMPRAQPRRAVPRRRTSPLPCHARAGASFLSLPSSRPTLGATLHRDVGSQTPSPNRAARPPHSPTGSNEPVSPPPEPDRPPPPASPRCARARRKQQTPSARRPPAPSRRRSAAPRRGVPHRRRPCRPQSPMPPGPASSPGRDRARRRTATGRRRAAAARWCCGQARRRRRRPARRGQSRRVWQPRAEAGPTTRAVASFSRSSSGRPLERPGAIGAGDQDRLIVPLRDGQFGNRPDAQQRRQNDVVARRRQPARQRPAASSRGRVTMSRMTLDHQAWNRRGA